jgi:type IV pilus assembly protein PilA
MRSRKGFTLIELMVVVLIVAVLAAILIPMLTARLESARWAEGKAGAGTIATSIRAMAAEMQDELASGFPTGTVDPLSFLTAQDLLGRYFDNTSYVLSNVALTPTGTYPVTYTIQVNPPSGSAPGASLTWTESGYTLTETGAWTKL